MMNETFKIVLFVHSALGAVALFIAPLAMITVKGGLWHRRWGKVYFWAMAGVALSAVVLCWLRSGLFLFLVAVFSFYLALTGYTVLRRKNPGDKAGVIDWCAALAVALASGGLIVAGALAADAGQRWVRLSFGFIGLLLGLIDIREFLRPSTRDRAWWFTHMTRFLAAYIATATAFSVVNLKFLPYFWRWLWPTMIGTAGITVWRLYYARKFAKQRAAA
jgi:uncharacterized membrane protein